MMRSLFSGVSALRNHQVRMDVIGNNIANVNTVGYKRSRVRFQDVFSQTLQDPARPQANRGGTNPIQVGLGMSIASIDVVHGNSSLQRTGSNTDMAIQGDGFFLVNDGNRTYYTRAGMFALDGDGSLVMKSTGMRVMGYQWMETGYSQTLSGLKVALGSRIPPQSTGEVVIAGNLNPNALDPQQLTIEVHDSQGEKHSINLTLTKSGDNQWDWAVSLPTGATIGGAATGGPITFDAQGELVSPTSLTLDDVQFNNEVLTQDITIDLTAVTQYVEEGELVVKSQDGYPASTLTTFGVDSAGIITAQYSSGRTEILGRFATALFSNPGGLIRSGSSLFEESSNSGLPEVGFADTGGRGKIVSQNLEMSNVDLSEEFTDMIVTQRGFQANSRIITTSDEMLQELVNLKR